MLLFMTYSEEEQEKFTSIFRQHYRVLIGKAYGILHSHHLAEDAVEEAFIRALKHLDRLSETDSMRTRRFFLVTVERIAITMYHKNQKIVPIDFEGQDEESIKIDPTWERFSSEETVQEIKNILYGLKPEDREVLIYKVVYQWSYEEIADVMGISTKNVSVRLSRIRRRIMKEYVRRRDGVR